MLPGLQHYQHKVLEQDLWKRAELTPRDRSLVTLAVVIGRQDSQLQGAEFSRALDNGVTAGELAEVITHLALYTGWGNAVQASATAQALFTSRGIDLQSLPQGEVPLLPINEQAELARVAAVESAVGHATFPALVDYTTDVLFHDLWLRSALAPRDRSLVTFSALVARGQVGQIGFHLNKALDNGLTQQEASEALGHMAFYTGWPSAMTAVSVMKEVFARRG